MSKGQQQQQPDWAKFGLEPNERQPLNPQQGQRPSTTAAAATATPPPAPPGKSSPGDVFGSQVQGANELFADDQVCTGCTITSRTWVDLDLDVPPILPSFSAHSAKLSSAQAESES